MNIFVLTATVSSNCFATKVRQTKTLLALAVTMVLSEYSHLSLLSPRAVKGRLPRLGEVPLAVHAQPQVVTAARRSPFNNKL